MNMDQTIERWFFKNEVCVWTTCCFRFFCQWTTFILNVLFSLHFALLFGLDLVRPSPIGSVGVFCFLFNVVGFGFPIFKARMHVESKKPKPHNAKYTKFMLQYFSQSLYYMLRSVETNVSTDSSSSMARSAQGWQHKSIHMCRRSQAQICVVGPRSSSNLWGNPTKV